MIYTGQLVFFGRDRKSIHSLVGGNLLGRMELNCGKTADHLVANC
jgi:hypothetical protein